MKLRDGTDFDQPLMDADLDAELVHWSVGKFPLVGELLDMVWLTTEEALRRAPEVFGVSYCFDNDDHVIWSSLTNPSTWLTWAHRPKRTP